MTVENTSYSPDSYSGNGSTTSFAITFDYLDDDHVVVKLIDTTETPNTITTLTSGTHYNITGGAVVTTAGNTPATGETLWIGRTTPVTQGTDFKNLSTFDAEDVEDALDKTILLMQEREEKVARSLLFKETSGYSDVEIDGTLAANKYLQVNSHGDGFDLVSSISGSDITVTDFAETLLDDTDAATARDTLGVLSEAEISALISSELGDALVGLIASTGNIIWVYKNTAMDGWAVKADVTDRVLAVKGGAGSYNANGGTEAGETWANLKAHTHTIAHTHTFSDTSSAPSATGVGGNAGDAAQAATSTHTHAVSGTTSAASSADSGAQSTSDVRPQAALGTLQYPDV